MKKILILAVVALFGFLSWYSIQANSPEEADRIAQTDQRQKDLAYAKDLSSRKWRSFIVKTGRGWYDGVYQSGLAKKISQSNWEITKETIAADARNKGIDIDNLHPGEKVWVPVGTIEPQKG